MRQFIAGFVVALLAVVPAVLLLLRKKYRYKNGTPQSAVLGPNKIQKNKNGHLKQLQELSKLTGELAHEIKNPLSIIKVNLKLTAEELGRLDLGRDDQRFTRAMRKITVIQKETDRLEQILDSFLRYVDRTELQLASTDINSLISDMVDFYSAQAQSHSVTIRQQLHNTPLVCKIDADMLKQVILNLFINAQQAMNEGGELIIKTERHKKDAVVRITDTGRGIDPDKLPNIFNAYYSSRPQGTGLGLPTAKKIVEAHNGTITVDSEPGKGTSFTIRLPLQT